MHIKLISIGSYYPEVCAFGTLIMSTEVVRLIIGKILCPVSDDLYLSAIGSGYIKLQVHLSSSKSARHS